MAEIAVPSSSSPSAEENTCCLGLWTWLDKRKQLKQYQINQQLIEENERARERNMQKRQNILYQLQKLLEQGAAIEQEKMSNVGAKKTFMIESIRVNSELSEVETEISQNDANIRGLKSKNRDIDFAHKNKPVIRALLAEPIATDGISFQNKYIMALQRARATDSSHDFAANLESMQDIEFASSTVETRPASSLDEQFATALHNLRQMNSSSTPTTASVSANIGSVPIHTSSGTTKARGYHILHNIELDSNYDDPCLTNPVNIPSM